MIKYKPKLISVKEHPTIIVGQNPGNQRKGTFDEICWHDNRSADLLNEAIDGYSNIILTNMCQYREIDDDKLFEGMNDLIRLILTFHPRKVICLGEFSYKHAEEIRTNGGEIYQRYRSFDKLPHPSYIVRFNKDKEKWIKDLRSLL